ncbi:GATA-type domain-containing protein [Meloidogyne graminicola]|uniref:GATA-type domain-containing protein n=1 Tax=Meloidogyne graminicola TaxID=189291 RepID=A0A8S9ZF48_9BILA|nr:GATA-type domain-containing protein [Meloidogyne graminicola]
MFKLFNLIFFCLINIQITEKIKPRIVGVKMNMEWEKHREFAYLKEEPVEERFTLRTKENYIKTKFLGNITKLLKKIPFDIETNMFKAEISKYSQIPVEELKIKIDIELVNNKIVKKLIPSLEKQKFKRNEFIEKDYFYETSIINKNNKEKNKNLDEKIKYFKENLLKNYWKEINLISYKIELLNKNENKQLHSNTLKDLERKVKLIGEKISKFYKLNITRLLQKHNLCNNFVQI